MARNPVRTYRVLLEDEQKRELDARLDALVAAQERTNQLLEWLGKLIAEKQPA